MVFRRQGRGGGWVGGVCSVALLCVGAAGAARPAKLSAWEQAEARRQAFQAEKTHTKASFGRVLDAYRAVYHENPADLHAPDAVFAVAELLGEQGHEFADEASARAAVGQYEFLRTQYPASRLREAALVAEARIERDELHDRAAARERFSLAVKEAPRSEDARVARGELAALGTAEPARRGAGASSASAAVGVSGAGSSGVARRPQGGVSAAADGLRLTDQSARLVGGPDGAAAGGVATRSGSQPSGRKVVPDPGQATGQATGQARPDEGAITTALQMDAPGPAASAEEPAGTSVMEAATGARPELPPPVRPAGAGTRRVGPLAQVTGIRHWSTPTYTRVAIDLGDEVTFEAARVPNPDRIFFDLHGARLALELVGKSFDVTDDGFLKKIRAAQSAGDVTRVVLDVNDVTEYSAFLLPNPYRLIIDIHGGSSKKTGTKAPAQAETLAEVPVAPAAVREASNAANVSGLPATAPTDGGALSRPLPAGEAASTPAYPKPGTSLPLKAAAPPPTQAVSPAVAAAIPGPRTGVTQRATMAKPVPNTVTVRSPETAVEVAAVSGQPGRVDATHAPTAKPIAAVVKPQPTGVPEAVPAPDLAAPARKGRAGTTGPGNAGPSAPAKAAEPTADGETSLVRALGLKIGRIVIDPGHGGHDSGTLGVDGIQEKDVVLDVALRLGKLLHDRLGAEIIYTRSDDTFIPLETRTAIANKAQADLFLSIHANSSQDPTARGVETYYLNFTSDPTALDVAARENAVGGQSIHQLSDLVKKITLKDKIAESREFAADVESSLYAGLQKGNDGLKNRGVKKAPFVVLIGANMPSILAEISFVTSPKDASELRQPEYRQRVAESLFTGVARYENGLSGGRPATGMTSVRAAAQ